MSVEVKNTETYLDCCFSARQPQTPRSGLKAVERLQLKELLMSKWAFVSQPRVAAGCGEMVWAGTDGSCFPASRGGWSSAALCRAELRSFMYSVPKMQKLPFWVHTSARVLLQP